MTRMFAITGLAVLTLGTAGFADTLPTVKSIQVDAELGSIENPAAAAYWTTISDDLENAIVAQLTDRIADDGVKVTIDLEEVSLSGGFAEAANLAETRLVGDVTMTHDSDNTRFGTYQLTVDINAAKPFIPEGMDVTTIPADSKVYYDAMIATFADGVVQRLK